MMSGVFMIVVAFDFIVGSEVENMSLYRDVARSYLVLNS